jgi:acetyl-CoA carboxylase carboxyltransferase component
MAGVCDLLIATRDACMGIAGPPLVAAALGQQLRPDEIGPAALHAEAGTVDLLCDDESDAVEAARAYLAFFTKEHVVGETPDPAKLRGIVPESRRRAYDVRKVVRGIADRGSVLELRPLFGRSAVIALARLAGRTVGFIANQPIHAAGAIDSDAADKMARFISLCDAYDFPIVMLCDTPGFMVGPASEARALVRHSGRVLMALGNATTPLLSVILRKAYGLGYYVMGSGAFEPALHVAWPTAEFGGMGLEGAVEIQHRDVLDAAPDDEARAALHARLVDEMRDGFGAQNLARDFSVDDVIDPAETRKRIESVLAAIPGVARRGARKHAVDVW